MKRVLAFAISSVLIAALSLLVLRAASRQVPSNAWEPTGDLARARTGAASALLYDGRMLMTGGVDATGAVTAEVERYSPDEGRFLATPPMEKPLSRVDFPAFTSEIVASNITPAPFTWSELPVN